MQGKGYFDAWRRRHPRSVADGDCERAQLRGSFRFREEFVLAVDYIDKSVIDVKPLISATLPFTQAHDAFELANDRSKSMGATRVYSSLQLLMPSRAASKGRQVKVREASDSLTDPPQGRGAAGATTYQGQNPKRF
jgi:hypothetical protein